MQSEQRKSQRFELRLPIQLLRSGSSTLGHFTETRNLSSGGVLFSCESQLPVGEPIEYTITLPTGKDPNGVKLHCVGTIIRLETRPPRMLSPDRERTFSIAATLERYEFVRLGR
jgi:hypothetical protein